MEPGQPSRVHLASLAGSASTVVTTADSGAVASGASLFFVRGTELLSQPFDASRGVVTGSARSVLKGVAVPSSTSTSFSVAPNGVVACVTGSPTSRRLAWFNRRGDRTEVLPNSEGYRNPMVSREGTRLAADRQDPATGRVDVWVVDLVRHVASRITSGAASYQNATWSPDGGRLAFNVLPSNAQAIFDLATQQLTMFQVQEPAPTGGGVRDWSPDGESILVQANSGQGHTDLWSLPVSGGHPRTLVASPGTDVDGQFSPDGRWLAYSSDISGRWETYVTPTNAQGAALPISNGGGLEARWRRDGRELFYLSLDDTLMAVDVQPGPRLVLGVPRRLFVAPVGSISTGRNHYDVGPDGQRFLVTEEIRTGAPLAITVLTDWMAASR